MKINVTYNPVLNFTTKFCRQNFLKAIKKLRNSIGYGFRLIFFSCLISHGTQREKDNVNIV